jgi:DNA-binding winged helix-turn-helix (wHTH) protein
MSEPAKKVFRFGVFEADTTSGELRKSGVRLKLQDQPFQVLLVLLERSGEVVSREELRQKLWPADTFVDFDHSLNTIINKLREVLSDSASNPRFIETLAKRGYRFLLPVEQATNHMSGGSLQAEGPAAAEPETPPTSLLTRQEDLPLVPHSYVRVLFLLIQIMYLAFYIAALARLTIVADLLAQVFGQPTVPTAILTVTAAIGIPVRLYLLSSVAFDVKDLTRKFLRLFPATFVLDELWALAPFLLTPQIGLGLALGATACLIYVPFAQRTLLLMRERSATARQS